MSPIAINDAIKEELRTPKAPLKASAEPESMQPTVSPTIDEPFSGRNPDGSYKVLNQPLGMRRKLRVVCVGAGASGINMAYKIQSHMKDVEFVTYDKNQDVGGTWYENRYPGVACDTNSHGYAFTYHLKPDWTAVFSPGGEIEEYMRDVVRSYGLSKYIKLNHQVLGATWDAAKAKWYVRVRKGDDPATDFTDTCDIFINASGLLNHWKMPNIPGISNFKGAVVHTAAWPEDLDLKGKRVALIGIGSSAIQVLPQIQPLVESCSIFIRSPTWIAPAREGELLTPEAIQRYRDHPEEHLEYCRDLESLANKRFGYITKGSEDQKNLYEAWSTHMQNGLKSRPEYYDKLHPSFGVGCRRPTPGPGFLEALTQSNVEAVFSGVDHIDETGLTTSDGDRREFDVIICATGFDVSFKPRFEVLGRDSINLQEQWAECPRAYLSMFAVNFPNYFTILGPGAPSAQGSIIVSIERISDYIIKFLDRFQHEAIKTFEVDAQAVEELAEHMEEQLKLTVWTDNCSSWFKNGTSSGPVIALHPGGRLHFFSLLMDPRYEDFKYTYWNKNRYAYWGNGYTLREVEGRNDTWYLQYADGLDLFKY
ncbi:uncharacterized protein IL334_003336 [Kwoniella shivajii]|uniref:FAD/NAD(P)-binding domain-containing protein n=1 Tax=Kwoniella shivajii TaxID=564305 RepID=A0ABZ1D095_9TREE|nr:hypothetical protein IL334_003336 [Kwoniella shivajii]